MSRILGLDVSTKTIGISLFEDFENTHEPTKLSLSTNFLFFNYFIFDKQAV